VTGRSEPDCENGTRIGGEGTAPPPPLLREEMEMKALSLFGDTIPAPVMAHAGRSTASGQAAAKEHRTARRGGLELPFCLAITWHGGDLS